MNREQLTLRSIVMALRRNYGKAIPPIGRDPFRLILWAQAALVGRSPKSKAWLIEAAEPLRQQGQEHCSYGPPVLA